jgi:phage baseplate assembly protein W
MGNEYLGTDLALDVDQGDIHPLPAGDLFLRASTDVVLQDIWLRIATPKGDLWCHPDYGVDIYAYIQAENTMTNRMAICAMVRDEVRKDPRITPESVYVAVKAWRAEEQQIDLEISLQIEGRTNRENLVVGYDLKTFGPLALRGA